jgi:hypothetical protein
MSQILGYAIPFGMIFVGMCAIVVGFGAVLVWPRHLLFGFLVCLLLVASSSGYGFEDQSDANVFWVKGSRTFFFTFVEMGILGAWLAMLYRHAWQRIQEPWLPLTKYYLGLAALLFGHALLGLLDPARFLLLDLSSRGFTYLLFQGMFVSLVVSTIRTERDLKVVVALFLLCLAGRHLFGLVRYVGFGGDPQNAYSVLGTSKVKITFWDVNDSILGASMFALCAWMLLTEKTQSGWMRLGLIGGMGMSLLIPLLSARRTGQGGMLLAVMLLAVMLPRGRRWPAVLALVVAVPLIVTTLTKRADIDGAGLLQRVLIDVKADPLADPRRTRFHELRTAWQSIKKEPIFGLGPSGRFKAYDPTGLEYHRGRYDFVHSGFGHILLKGGFVGLILFMGVMLSWIWYVRRHWAVIQGPARALSVAAAAGLMASMPNLFVGAPIGELRTMLLMGLLMALPIAAVRIAQRQASPKPAATATPQQTGYLRPAVLSRRGASW